MPSVHNITLDPGLPYPARSIAINKAGPNAVYPPSFKAQTLVLKSLKHSLTGVPNHFSC